MGNLRVKLLDDWVVGLHLVFTIIVHCVPRAVCMQVKAEIDATAQVFRYMALKAGCLNSTGVICTCILHIQYKLCQ